MKFFTQILPTLVAVGSLAQASAVVPRTDDRFFSEFIDALNNHNLTILADNYQRIADTPAGKSIVDTLENNELTILATKDRAFENKDTNIDPRVIQYNTLWGSIDKGFKTTIHTRRGADSQSRSVAESTFKRSSAPNRKRQDQASNFQSQVVDKLAPKGSRKRWNEETILIDRAVGTAKVVDRFSFKKLVILIIDTVLTLPEKVSELLCKPLIKSAPNGLTKFGEALKKVGLADMVDTKDAITIFAPVDESLDKIDELSNDDLASFLKNHFFFGQIVYSPLFLKVCKATAQSGKELELSYENSIHYVSCGKSRAIVLRSDVIPSNGVLHVIDKPLKCD
ncbi:FAS1 domain-containing protein [Rhizoctonia solani]|nr:FAS1 domain-containing protein [Rhizoctonia solani]